MRRKLATQTFQLSSAVLRLHLQGRHDQQAHGGQGRGRMHAAAPARGGISSTAAVATGLGVAAAAVGAGLALRRRVPRGRSPVVRPPLALKGLFQPDAAMEAQIRALLPEATDVREAGWVLRDGTALSKGDLSHRDSIGPISGATTHGMTRFMRGTGAVRVRLDRGTRYTGGVVEFASTTKISPQQASQLRAMTRELDGMSIEVRDSQNDWTVFAHWFDFADPLNRRRVNRLLHELSTSPEPVEVIWRRAMREGG